MRIEAIANPAIPTYCIGEIPGVDAAVGIVSVEILAPNIDRVGLIISNYGNKAAWLSWTEDAVANAGIWLDKGAIGIFDGSLCIRTSLNAITDSGTTSLAWQEYSRS